MANPIQVIDLEQSIISLTQSPVSSNSKKSITIQTDTHESIISVWDHFLFKLDKNLDIFASQHRILLRGHILNLRTKFSSSKATFIELDFLVKCLNY